MKELSGLKDLLPFLNYLEENKIWYVIVHDSHDAIMVAITLVGERIEIEFFDDHVEYSRFKGDESVEEDQDVLFGLIDHCVHG